MYSGLCSSYLVSHYTHKQALPPEFLPLMEWTLLEPHAQHCERIRTYLYAASLKKITDL